MNRPTYDATEVLADLQAVAAEVRAAFRGNRFAVLRRERPITQIHAAAALAHTCYLANELVELHRRDSELAARLVARALFESWVSGVYIHYGGYEALTSLWDEFHYQVKTQADEAQKHDDRLIQRREAVRRKNEKIEASNRGKARWNQANPIASPGGSTTSSLTRRES